MPKLRVPMNQAQKQQMRENQEVIQMRKEIRELNKKKGTVTKTLSDRIKELKFKKRYPGVYNRALADGQVPWL